MDHIEELQNDRDDRLRRLDAQISVVSKRPESDGGRGKMLDDLNTRRDAIKQMYENALADAKARRDAENLAEKIRSNALADKQAQEAAKQAERFRYAAWREFFKAGGTKVEFDSQWPQLRQKLIEERLQNPKPAQARKNAHL